MASVAGHFRGGSNVLLSSAPPQAVHQGCNVVAARFSGKVGISYSHSFSTPGLSWPVHEYVYRQAVSGSSLARLKPVEWRRELGQTSLRAAASPPETVIGESPKPEELPESAPEAAVSVEPEEELSQATLIWRAVKLPIYTVALIPLMVGAAAAYLKTGVFYSGRFFLFLLSSVLVIAWLNLSNDAFDAETGVDKDKPESVVNMTGSRTGVLVAAFACLAAGLGGIFQLASQVRDARVAVLLAAAIACGYVYQSPPFRLSYKGLGEPLCFLAFGPLATTAFYLSQASTVLRGIVPVASPTVLGASVLVGITTTLILFCSHFHQIETDLAVGKMSPLVRIGTAKGARVAQAGVYALYAITAVLVAMQALPVTCAVTSLLTLPLGKKVVDFITTNHTNKQVIFMAKYYMVRLHVAYGLGLALGLAVGGWKPLSFSW